MAISPNTCQATIVSPPITNSPNQAGRIQFFQGATPLTGSGGMPPAIVVNNTMTQMDLQDAINANIIVPGVTIQITNFDKTIPGVIIFTALITVPSSMQITDLAVLLYDTGGPDQQTTAPFLCNLSSSTGRKKKLRGAIPSNICLNKYDSHGKENPCSERLSFGGIIYQKISDDGQKCCYTIIK